MLNILNSEIPPGGRFLTSSECRKLRKHYPAHCGLRVMPDGVDYIGTIYRPNTVDRIYTAVCRARFGGDV